MSKKAKILWMDLEMTGLDPVRDRIMEVAVIATDWEFNELASYEAAIKVDQAVIDERMLGVAADFWTANPASRDALLLGQDQAQSVNEVEQSLIGFIDEQFEEDERILLAGNSIHQDRKFIENEWPSLNERLHYRMLDVSAWKVVFDGKYGKRFAKPEEHRALADIRGSIQELKYYLAKVKV